MNLKTSAVMSTKIGEKPILCDTKSSSGNMDCNWNGAKHDQISPRPRPMSDTLSKLAQLITCMEYKQKSQKPSSICKSYEHESADPNAPAARAERDHALQKLHRCHPCGKKFNLLSTLQLHKCPRLANICQTCSGKPTMTSSCPSCGTVPSQDAFYRDSGPLACALCGQAFTHKQELLVHQQAGDCQPSHSSLPPSTCTLCSRTFRSSAGLACHIRFSHPQAKEKKTVVVVSAIRRKKKVLISSLAFQCRSCDKSFPKTSLLHRHRREEHCRDVKVRNPLKLSGKVTRQRRKGETYPCLHCGKEFLHHLTRWAHFRHYSSHHQTHIRISGKSDVDAFNPKPAVELVPVAHQQPRPRGRPRKYPLAVTPTKKHDPQEEAEDSQYPCTSCERVFSSKAQLYAHEQIHEELPEELPEDVQAPAEMHRCCSVCKGGIPHDGIPEDCERRVYHCVPCAEAFITLDGFLEHCQKHLIRDREDEFSDD